MLNDIIATLLTVGGVGFVNFMVTEQLGTVNLYKESNQARLGYSLIWSIIDFSIYLLAKNLLSSYLQGDMLLIAVMLITLVGAWLITYLLAWPLHDLLFKWYSFRNIAHRQWKNKHGKQQSGRKPAIDNSNVWQTINELLYENANTYVYAYDFEHNPLGYGLLTTISNDEESNYSVLIEPFDDPDDEVHEQDPYDVLMKKIQKNSYQKQHKVIQYVDFKQRFILITATEINEKD